MLALLAVAALVVPVAIAYACNPQAHVSLDKTSYQPGGAISVHGSYFTGNSSVTVAGPVDSKVVTTSPGGGFSTNLTAPSAPGNYVVTASRPTGGFASVSFSVATPVPAQSATQSGSPSTGAPATAAPARSAPSFKAPSVAHSNAPASADRTGTRTSRSSGSASTSRSGSTSGVTSVAGQQVFAGSAPAASAATTTAARTPAATGARSRSTASRPAIAGTAPADQAALSDLFSNYQPGRTPSLMGGSGAPAGGTGSGLGLGIGMLAFGLLALVAGLTAAEVRRRRPA